MTTAEPTDHGRNPVLPPQLHIPDPEARVMPDGRVYVYGSWDQHGGYFCSPQYRVVSSADLRTWTDHGESFNSAAVPWVHDEAAARRHPGTNWFSPDKATPFLQRLMAAAKDDSEFRIPAFPKGLLFAPDAVARHGRYYLYFCMPDQTEGVAVADHPAGPFGQARQLACGGIDPAVFVDDDGQAYFYWGQFAANGARLHDDMLRLDEASTVHGLVTEQAHHFHEGSSLRKRGSLYYLVYSSVERGKPTSLAYATATSPLGPFTHRGVIIDNAACDPKSWNNHGSIECIGGQWYVFYHRSSRRSQQWRRLCIEPISFDAEGRIAEVPMTSTGAGRPYGLGEAIEGWRACGLQGSAWIGPDDQGHEVLQGLASGDEAVWRWLQLDQAATTLQVDARGSGDFTLQVGPAGAADAGDGDAGQVGAVSLRDGRVLRATLALPAGRHTLRLRVHQADGLALRSLSLHAA